MLSTKNWNFKIKSWSHFIYQKSIEVHILNSNISILMTYSSYEHFSFPFCSILIGLHSLTNFVSFRLLSEPVIVSLPANILHRGNLLRKPCSCQAFSSICRTLPALSYLMPRRYWLQMLSVTVFLFLQR